MANEANQSFDLDRLRQLVKLMDKYDLREVKLKGGGQEWVLRRGGDPVPFSSAPINLPMAPAVPSAPGGAPAAGSSTSETPADDGLMDVKSPMVGTFYRSPSPDEPPFVKEGDHVTPDTVVCLVEAMKFFNQIKAEVSGTITRICVTDGDPVEFGQPLFKVRAG